MLDTRQRRPLELTSSVSGEGLFSGTPQPVPQLTPSEPPRAACPVNPRPRDDRAYKAACTAAEGEKVKEYNAVKVEAGMRAWCNSRFLTVVKAQHMHLSDFQELHKQFTETALAHPFVLLLLAGDGATTGWIIGELDTPVYCLA